MRELSFFVDESGDTGPLSRYYLVTAILHDQGISLAPYVQRYQESLRIRCLDEISMHTSPLMKGNDAYRFLDIEVRRKHLAAFTMTLIKLPVRYHTFIYDKRIYQGADALHAVLRRDLVDFIFDNLPLFQGYDVIKVYYDNGQRIVTTALKEGLAYALSRNVATYKISNYEDYFLAQAADYICTVELTALKYDGDRATKTDRYFFGSRKEFRKNYLKQIRRMRI